MRWLHCLEIVALGLAILATVVAAGIALIAVIKGYRRTADLRRPAKLSPPTPTVNLTDEQRLQHAAHGKAWRDKYAGYAADINALLNPLRRDTIDIIKESANWARLGVQYALIGNGGGLVALPYLLSQTAVHKLPITDAIWSALWFALGIAAAALVCLIAYVDFLVNASMNWVDIRMIEAAARQRHFETGDEFPIESNLTMRNALLSVVGQTSITGIVLAFLAWLALMWGALRIVVSLSQ